jgi:hypothetical protein
MPEQKTPLEIIKDALCIHESVLLPDEAEGIIGQLQAAGYVITKANATRVDLEYKNQQLRNALRQITIDCDLLAHGAELSAQERKAWRYVGKLAKAALK